MKNVTWNSFSCCRWGSQRQSQLFFILYCRITLCINATYSLTLAIQDLLWTYEDDCTEQLTEQSSHALWCTGLYLYPWFPQPPHTSPLFSSLRPRHPLLSSPNHVSFLYTTCRLSKWILLYGRRHLRRSHPRSNTTLHFMIIKKNHQLYNEKSWHFLQFSLPNSVLQVILWLYYLYHYIMYIWTVLQIPCRLLWILY